MVAFAANSILCRLALGDATIDAASFTTIRLASGALMLLLVSAMTPRGAGRAGSDWLSAFLLFAYAVAFSFAYISLGAGTGALILFGAVQATMLIVALRTGERPHALEWIGLVLAVGGLVYLTLPGLSAPSPIGSALMAVAGVAWGFYSLRGRRAGNPKLATTANFVRSVPIAVIVSAIAVRQFSVSPRGALLAVLSGAVASGLGYVLWYTALKGLTATRAAIVQLSVPVIAAIGGVMFLSEQITWRLLVSSALILGGVALSATVRSSSAPSPATSLSPDR
ncbi:MAG: EamA family transporter [Acidobacteria bacterium]|nr:EamA family transporter [Acidobacteriota bacterium]NIM60456.1 EamA family transporter [Acidobacteriota bacterium]NIO60367.1 EamA family transporter [Acidobacteriota bacterium]NIQ31439.1 EamA family transporter [Acidobacteriota bacterium]NIQ86683.1 EamA family transporter [Acidobacteriota bacterium]